MSLLWCRFDCDWQEDPFVAPLDAAERNVVGTVYLIAARRGEPTWRPPNPAKQEVGPQPENMRVGLDWLEPSYVARRSGADFTTAQRVLQKMRDAKKVLVEGADYALVRNVGKFNAEPLRDARRKRENKRRPSPADPQPEDRGLPDTLETPAGAVPSAPPPSPVEGRKEGRKEVTTEGEGGALLVLPQRPTHAREPGALALIAAVHQASGLFPGQIDFANSPMNPWVNEWLDSGYPAAHIALAYQAVSVAMGEPDPPKKPAYAIRHLVQHTPVGSPMSWSTRTAGDGTAPWKPKKGKALTPADMRADAARLEAEGK